MSKRLIAGTGFLLLTGGCYSHGTRMAADLPRTRPLPTQSSSEGRDPAAGDVMIPVRHPPDGAITAREPYPRWEAMLNAALVRTEPSPLVIWSMFAVWIAF